MTSTVYIYHTIKTAKTSCVHGDTICLRPLQVDNIFAFIHQVAPVLACWLFKTSATSWPFNLESDVRVTCDVGYLCANFSLPRPLYSRLRPDVHNRRQTDRRQTDESLNASALWWRRHNKKEGDITLHYTDIMAMCFRVISPSFLFLQFTCLIFILSTIHVIINF